MTKKDIDEKVEDEETEDEEVISEDDTPDDYGEAEDADVIEEDGDLPEEDPKDEEIENLKREVEESEDKYLKLSAEFENFKRRNRQENELNQKYKDQKIAESLLPVLDNLERAMAIEGDADSFDSLKKGVEMVHNDFLNTFEKHEIKSIDSVGEAFDPNYHQAVMTEASDEGEGVILEEFQSGYMLKDRVIRPSMVKVSE